jgi:hypothetical protein
MHLLVPSRINFFVRTLKRDHRSETTGARSQKRYQRSVVQVNACFSEPVSNRPPGINLLASFTRIPLRIGRGPDPPPRQTTQQLLHAFIRSQDCGHPDQLCLCGGWSYAYIRTTKPTETCSFSFLHLHFSSPFLHLHLSIFHLFYLSSVIYFHLLLSRLCFLNSSG